MIAAIAVGVALLTRPAHQPVPGTSGASRSTIRVGRLTIHIGPDGDRRYAMNSPKLTFGMTKQQVLRLVGPPSKTVGDCWQYRLDENESFNGTSAITNAERVCFYAGHYSISHTEVNGTWR